MSRTRLIVPGLVIVASLGWVAARGLTGSLVYYLTPTDVLQGRAAVGERVRLGGFVLAGSVEESGTLIRFMVSDGTSRMSVLQSSGVPALFREGQGVVVEGFVGRDGLFHADTVLIKHDGSYEPPTQGETPHSADLSQGE
ncbi:MAG: cytochrome c maturation protein CcmE [Actinomycetota bacterium]